MLVVRKGCEHHDDTARADRPLVPNEILRHALCLVLRGPRLPRRLEIVPEIESTAHVHRVDVVELFLDNAVRVPVNVEAVVERREDTAELPKLLSIWVNPSFPVEGDVLAFIGRATAFQAIRCFVVAGRRQHGP